jgi:hypothetical protein
MPPTEESKIVPVRGERETTDILAEVGAGVPQRGPTAKISGREGSKGSSLKESFMRWTPRPLPPRYDVRISGEIISVLDIPDDKSTCSPLPRHPFIEE